jgi:hypothetical protein
VVKLEKFGNCREKVDDGLGMEVDIFKNQLFRTICIHSKCLETISGGALIEHCNSCNYCQIVEEADIQSEIEIKSPYT